jgi:type IV pilus assembly protein PilM
LVLEGNIKDLIYHKKDVIGLDIGTSSVKFVQLKKAGKLVKLVGYGKVIIPENTVIEGIISEPEKLAELITKTFSAPPWGKITANRVFASLPESKLFTRIIDLPNLDPKDVEEAVKYDIEQSIPMPADDLYIDWQIINEGTDKVTVFLAAAPKSIVNSYIQFLSLLKMEPMGLEMSLAAIARSMVSNKDKVEPVIILDLGDQTSNLAIFDSNLRVTGSHPIGGGTIKSKIAQTLNISDKEAASEVRMGIKGNTKAAKIIKNDIDELIAEIDKMVQYYNEKQPEKKINKVLLCGGLGFLPGLPEYIKEQGGFEAKVGNPWVNISIYPLKPVPKDEAPGYAPAIGLCLRGFSDD